MSTRADQDYCGCCGNPCRGEWCIGCRKHLLPTNGHRHAWERTWFAQHQTDCPRQAQPDPCGWSMPHRHRHSCDCVCALQRRHDGRHYCQVQLDEFATPLRALGVTQ